MALASRLIDAEVVDRNGSRLGRIRDLIVDERGRLGGAFVEFTWLDDELAGMPMSELGVRPDGSREPRIVVDKNVARGAPTFRRDEIASISGWMVERIRRGTESNGEGRSPKDRDVGDAAWRRMSEVLDRSVRSTSGEDLGDVEDFVVDLSGGELRAVVLGTGGFLGIGEDLHVIRWNDVSGMDEDGVRTHVDKTRLESMPSYTRDSELIRAVHRAEPEDRHGNGDTPHRDNGDNGDSRPHGEPMHGAGNGDLDADRRTPRTEPQDESTWIVEVIEITTHPATGFRTPTFPTSAEPVDLSLELEEGEDYNFVVTTYDFSGEAAEDWQQRFEATRRETRDPHEAEAQGDRPAHAGEDANAPYRAEYTVTPRHVDRDGSAILDVEVCWCRGWTQCGVGQSPVSVDEYGLGSEAMNHDRRQLRVRIDANGRIGNLEVQRNRNQDFIPAHPAIVEKQLAAILGSGLHDAELQPGTTVEPEITGATGREVGGHVSARYRGVRDTESGRVAHFDVLALPRTQAGGDDQGQHDGNGEAGGQAKAEERGQEPLSGTKIAGFATYDLETGLLDTLTVHPGLLHEKGDAEADALVQIRRVESFGGTHEPSGERSDPSGNGDRR